MTLTVAVNGSLVTTVSGGSYIISPGDLVEVTTNQPAVISTASTSEATAALLLHDATTTSTSFTVQLGNVTTSPAILTVSGSATDDASNTANVSLSVGAGDDRNGRYRVYAAYSVNTLLLDFNSRVYDMTDGAGSVTSGTFTSDASDPGTYVFANERVSGANNTARFRTTVDAVVGLFPFAAAPGEAGQFPVMPFIAARNFAIAQGDLVGVYNSFATQVSNRVQSASIAQMDVTAGGGLLHRCKDAVLYDIGNCPAASTETYFVTASDAPGQWLASSAADPASNFRFHVARIGGENVYLSDGPVTPVADTSSFIVGIVPNVAPRTLIAHGGNSLGEYGSEVLASSNVNKNLTRPDGTADVESHNVATTSYPAGIRRVDAATGTDQFFLAQGVKLSVLMGDPANAATRGYFFLGFND